MTTMRSMNPEAPRFVNATSAAANYANLVNTPRYAVANKFFDDLNKEQLANELREEELRRYNQGFGLQQAEADRKQAIYDRGLNTDKALVDYQNIIHGTAQGGIMNNEQGASLANEYQKLVGTVGEDKAAEIINAKAQMLAQQDAQKAQSDPYYAANKVQGVAINGNRYGDIDPTKLIDMQRNLANDLYKRGDSERNYNLQAGSKNREQLLKAQERLIKTQQLIAMGYNPNALAEDQWDTIIKSKPENQKFDIVKSKDSNGNEIGEFKLVDNKEVKEKERKKQDEENYKKYTDLLGSKEFINLAEADTFGNNTTEIVDIASQAKIPPEIVKNILATKSGQNRSKWFETSLKYDDFNKYKVQNPKKPDEWTPLGNWLKAMQENPTYIQQVTSGVASPNIVQMSEEDLKKQKDLNWFIP